MKKQARADLVEIRGVDGRLLALVSRDGRTLQIKRRNVVYTVDLVRTWVEGRSHTLAIVDNVECAGVE